MRKFQIPIKVLHGSKIQIWTLEKSACQNRFAMERSRSELREMP